MQLSLSVKLTLTFIALLIIPIISGIFAYSSITQDRQIRQQMNEHLETELRVDRVTADFHLVVLSLHDYLATGNKEEAKNYQSLRAKLDRDFKDANAVLNEDERRTLLKVKKHLSNMDVLAGQVFAIPNPKDNMMVIALIEQFDDSAVRGEEITSEIRETIDGLLEETLARSNTIYETLRMRLNLAFLFLILGPLIFWIAGRNISIPIYNLVGEAERLGQGKWDKEVAPQPGIEVGTLSDTLERMRENLVRYRSEATSYRKTLEREVNLLQAALLPHTIPDIKGLDVGSFYHSATAGLAVGGDFYDLIPLPNDRWGLVIGDVCGRGIESASLTALARFSLRSFALEELDPAKVLERLNKVITRQTPSERFITIWYGVWNPESKTITFSNGGHPYPILVSSAADKAAFLSGSDMALGFLSSATYSCSSIELSPGDILVLYTDGLTEARSKTGEFLGDDRAAEFIKGLKEKDAKTIAQETGSFCIDWASGELGDDVAIVAVKVSVDD